MIRDRSSEDLDRLCEVLNQVSDHDRLLQGRSPWDWLQMPPVERAWVFDQAPISVTPTRNVIGQVLIYRPIDARWANDVAVHVDRQSGELRVIGRLFVEPSKHAHNIARYLLKESVKYVEACGHVAVLDPADLAFIPLVLPQRLGFTESRVDGGTTRALIRNASGRIRPAISALHGVSLPIPHRFPKAAVHQSSCVVTGLIAA